MRLATTTFLTVSKSHHSLREIVERHAAVVDALRTHDPDAAERALRLHIEEPGEWLRAALEEEAAEDRRSEKPLAEKRVVMTQSTWNVARGGRHRGGSTGVHHPRRVEEFRAGRRLYGCRVSPVGHRSDRPVGVPRTARLSEPRLQRRGGWLLADRSYQDVAVFASFRCAAGCQTGVMLRAERTPDGGMKGMFVSLNEGDLAAYRVTVDREGAQTSKERLRGPGGGQLRVALPPPNPAPPAAGARAGGPPGLPPFPGGIASPDSAADAPVCARATGTRSKLVLDANILRAFLNDAGGIGDSVAETEYGAYGPFALYVGGTGEVRFKDVSHKDLQPRVAQPEKVSSRFPDAAGERVLLFMGSCGRRLQSRRNARHRRRSVLLPRSGLHDRSRNLHRRHHRSWNAVLQRPAVRLRLHG